MIIFKNVSTIQGKQTQLKIPSIETKEIDATGLTVLPALIDPHVHLRVPGAEHKENWMSGAQAAIAGGITTVFDMPNNRPSCVTAAFLKEKKALIQSQLDKADIPLHFGLYFGADRNYFDEIPKVKGAVVGLKIFMGSSTGTLLIDDDPTLERVFKLAADSDMIVAVHAEDELIIKRNFEKYHPVTNPAMHSHIRSPEAAETAVAKAIALSKKTGARLYILHMSTKKEVELVRKAKKDCVTIFAETTPHHLFMTVQDYEWGGMRVKVNPPLRSQEDQDALWGGIHDGTIDAIGTDHAPHTLEEKARAYMEAPSGVPGLETHLPLLLNAYHERKMTLDQIVALTRTNIQRFFKLETNEDWVLVDLNQTRSVEKQNLKTKCGWSPFEGRVLRGWPVYTILKNRVYHVV